MPYGSRNLSAKYRGGLRSYGEEEKERKREKFGGRRGFKYSRAGALLWLILTDSVYWHGRYEVWEGMGAAEPGKKAKSGGKERTAPSLRVQRQDETRRDGRIEMGGTSELSRQEGYACSSSSSRFLQKQKRA